MTGVTVEHKGERSRDRDRARRQRRAACSRPRSAGWRASSCPSSRWPTSTCSPSPWPASTRGCPSCATRTTSSTSARRSAACAWVATSAIRRRGRVDGVPADFNGKLLAPDMPRFEPIMEGAIRRVPAIAEAGVSRVINGPEGLHPGQRVHPRRERGPGLLGGRRLLRPRHRRRRRRRSPGGQLDRRWRARARPVEDGHPALRGELPLARLHAGPRRSRTTRPTTTSTTRTRSARPAGRCGPRRPTSSSRRLGAVFGEKSGWERPNWFESNAAAGDEALRPDGWAGHHWSPAIGAEALATRQAAGLFDETLVRQDRGQRGRAPRRSSSTSPPTTSTARSAASSTPSCSTGAAASRPT